MDFVDSKSGVDCVADVDDTVVDVDVHRDGDVGFGSFVLAVKKSWMLLFCFGLFIPSSELFFLFLDAAHV